MRQRLSPLFGPVGAVDAPCFVAGLVAGWLRPIAVPGFWLALEARCLFSVPGWPLATNSSTP